MQNLDICDFDLISRLRNDDELAFGIVFEKYSGKLYNFSHRFLKNREQCQEVVPIAPYLYTITRRLTLNTLRNIASSESAMSKLWVNMQQVSNETEDEVNLEDLRRFTEEVLSRLPQRQQLVYRMSRQQELSYDEIAEELNISRNTVKNHLVAALKTIKTQLHKALFLLL